MQVKIVKTNSKQWLGNGFGTSTASWGILSYPQIRIKRESGLWIAYSGIKRCASESKQGLEILISKQLKDSTQ